MTTKIQRTEHKNAIVKLVKAKRMILQIDISSVMNSKNIPDTVETLVKEGKLKRQKIQVRGPVGNLTNQWLVYDNSVKQNDILDFERLTINKYFQSPLVENHCYKSPEMPIEQKLKTNVIDLQEYIKINKQEIKIKEYRETRVVTVKDIAIVHEKPIKAVNQQMERNKHRLVKDVDYFVIEKGNLEVTASDLGNLFNSNRQREAYLLTEVGYLMLVKTFTDDLAWDVQRQLVNSYFKLQEVKEKLENNLPINKETVDVSNTYDILKVLATGVTDLNDRVKTLESTIESLKNAISA